MHRSYVAGARLLFNHLCERLEGRSLLSVVATTSLGDVTGTPGGPVSTIDLSSAFDETTIGGTVVRLATTSGNIDLELFDQSAPKTSQNFVNYVANHLYDGSIFHAATSGFVIQGGHFYPGGSIVPQQAPVENEFASDRSNLRGTIAAVPISSGQAQSDWLINLGNNAASLDAQHFSVFGKLLGSSLSVADTIGNLPHANGTTISPAFSDVPVRTALATGATPTDSDLVTVLSASVIKETKLMNLSVVSDHPEIVTPTLSDDGLLTLSYGTTPGFARITVTATRSGSTVSQSFTAANGTLEVQLGEGGVGSSLKYTEADGGVDTLSIGKGGSALVQFTGTGLAVVPGKHPGLAGTVNGISFINTIDTGVGTAIALKIKGGDGVIDVGSLTTTTPLKSLAFKQVRLSGPLTIGGTVKTVDLGSVTNGDLIFGGSVSDRISLSLSLGTATNVDITSGMPIKNLKADAFNSSSSTQPKITAPAVTSVTVKGAFQESLITTGAIKSMKISGSQKGDISGTTLGGLTAASLDGGIFNFSATKKTIGKITIAGAITNTTIRSGGDIAAIKATSISAARFYAGVNVADDAFPPFLPTDASQFPTFAKIGAVTVLTQTEQISLAAAFLGKVLLGKTATDFPIPFGIAAMKIDQLAGGTADTDDAPGVPFSFKKLDDQASFDAMIAAQAVPLGNLVVTLF